MLIENGPTQTGTLADLYAGADLPQTLANLLGDLVWCDQSAAYIEHQDPARVYLTPTHHRRRSNDRPALPSLPSLSPYGTMNT